MKLLKLIFTALFVPCRSFALSSYVLMGAVHTKTESFNVDRYLLTNSETRSVSDAAMTGITFGYLILQSKDFGLVSHIDVQRRSDGFNLFQGSLVQVGGDINLIYSFNDLLIPYFGLKSEVLLEQVNSNTWNQEYTGLGLQIGIGSKIDRLAIECFKSETSDKMFDIFRTGSTRQSSIGVRLTYAMDLF